MAEQNERELLELAAKAIRAAGDREFANYTVHDNCVCLELGSRLGDITRYWHPLTDDGDEARLEALVGIDIEWQAIGVVASINGGTRFREAYADHGGDKQKARRYAGVRAAAEIGRSLK